ncbi:MAG: copper-translocating P-type ATPase, partial [Flavobacteriaceae bacterium]
GVSVDLDRAIAEIEFEYPVPLQSLQSELSVKTDRYTISDVPFETTAETKPTESISPNPGQGSLFYCPMQCEGDKTYNHPGDCPVCGMDLVPVTSAESSEADSHKKLVKKFWWALIFTIPIFIIAMSEMIPSNPLYRVLPQNIWNWIQLLLSIPVVFYSCWMFFERAFRSIRSWNLNMFTLIGMGAGVAWVFSLTALLFPGIFPDQFKSGSGDVHVYFEAATVILTLVLMGQVLESRAHTKTTSAIRELIALAPQTAIRLHNGVEETIMLSNVRKGDILRVKPGQKIPVDGFITKGQASVDESMISGEPIPLEKMLNDPVISGTINGNTTFLMQAEKVGSDTLLAHIIEMVNEASRSRAPIQSLADRISGYFVPAVVIIAIITFLVWSVWGPYPAYVYGLVNALAVLIIACPCALGLATPMSVMVGIGKGATSGILFRNATALQELSKITTLVVDKTGTLTEGKPSVAGILSLDKGINQQELIRYAAALNHNSEHPLAEATVNYAHEKGIKSTEVENFKALAGQGVAGIIERLPVLLGNKSLIDTECGGLSESIEEQADVYQREGKTVTYIAIQKKVVGMVVYQDSIKGNSKEVIKEFHEKGIDVIMLTGDNDLTAGFIARQLGISDYKASLMPADKLDEVVRLRNTGRIVAMAGDGINDAPALASSDVGIAMGTGTDVAIESADITLVKGNLKGIIRAYNLSHSVMKNIRQNLFFALIYNVLGVPIAAGLLYPIFGILLSPMIAAAAMSFSSVSVIANALRLRSTTLDR